MTKMTFTLDEATVNTIAVLAARQRAPKSRVVRDAVAAYARQEQTLNEEERERRLRVLEDLATQPRTRPRAEVDQELRAIRRARRTGWHRSTD